MSDKIKLSDTEWQIMNALWRNHPATAREIIQEMQGEVRWAYTTVKTMLNRLVKKKAIHEFKRSNLSFYEPLIAQKKAHYSAIKSLFDNILDGSVEPVMHFLAKEKKLSEKNRGKLMEILNKMDQEKNNGDNKQNS